VQLAGAVTADQLRFVPHAVVEEAARFAGAAGTVLHGAQTPVAVHGAPLPAPPLLVDGF
jgi:hypothetical protein